MRFHDLRHTFVSILIGEGVPTADVQKLARHASYQTTIDIYRHLLPEQLEKRVKQLNVMLQSIEETIEKIRRVRVAKTQNPLTLCELEGLS